MHTPFLKTIGKRLLSLLYSHREGSLPDIFIFSTQRSGSTLLFDMLASQPGFKAVGEPFQERKQPAMGRYLPRLYSRYVELEGGEMQHGVEAYMSDLLAGKFVGGFERSYNLRNPRHHFRSHRNAVKVLRATQLLDWFPLRFPGSYILLLRHPIPTALSRSRNGWEAPLEDFIAQEGWFNGLKSDQQDFVRSLAEQQVSSEADSQRLLFRRHLVVWCLEHTGVLPCGVSSMEELENGVLLLHYEELVVQAEDLLPRLAERWQVSDRDAFVSRFTTPSRSAKYSADETKSAIGRGDAVGLLGRWRERVDADDLLFASKALETFDISAYRADAVMPLSSGEHRAPENSLSGDDGS